jgi:hypothetical protein
MGAAFLLIIFIVPQAERAEAGANLTAFTSAPPNSWEPMLYNVTGTAPYFITHTLWWNNVKIMGNVGIGDGRMRTLNGMSNRDINYTDNNFMAADISMAPWNPGRLAALSVPASAVTAANASQAGGNATNATGNVTTPGASIISFNRPLNDPYHPILTGRPVDDLLYEYPLATTINMYSRLLGLRMPGGSCANIGVKCLSYGY